MKSLTINVDVDGVLYDFIGHCRMLGVGYFNRVIVTEAQITEALMPEANSWHIWEDWDISRDEWYEFFNWAIQHRELFSGGQPIEGAVRGVMKLVNDGHRVRLITSKNLRSAASTYQAQSQCVEWLHRVGLLNWVELVFTGNKQGYPAQVAIDDKGDWSWVQAGATNILFDQPWNREAPIGILNRYRATGWDAVLRLVAYKAENIRAVSNL